MVAGSIRRKVEDAKPLSWEDIALKLEDVTEQRDQCLIALLYLSGRRINEILGVQKKDFKREKNRISFETFNEKDYQKTQRGDHTYKRYVNFAMFKNRKSPPFEGELYFRRIRPHWLTTTESGKALSRYVVERLGSLKETGYLFAPLQGHGEHIGYGMAYQIIKFYFPSAWPHLFRHERFTEAAKLYQKNPLDLHRFTFHKRLENTFKYIRDLEEEKI